MLMKYTYLNVRARSFFIIAHMAAFNNSDSEPDDFLNINDYENDLRNVQTQASEGDTSFSEGETSHHGQATRQTSTAGRQSETTNDKLRLKRKFGGAFKYNTKLKKSWSKT
jgi:hypothetical protein